MATLDKFWNQGSLTCGLAAEHLNLLTPLPPPLLRDSSFIHHLICRVPGVTSVQEASLDQQELRNTGPHQELPSLPPPVEETPDLECAVCFSQFNNAFRTPKMLQCKHTFCLECLARMNIKSAQPDSIQCPLCRSVTPLPATGLPKLDNNPTILAHLPEAMQRVYSVRFSRKKGRLQLKRPKKVQGLPLPTVSHSLDVGVPRSSDSSSIQQRSILQQLSCKSRCCTVITVIFMLLLVLSICTVIYLNNH
ncbi:RING finger protein 183 [Arapaima gigas]